MDITAHATASSMDHIMKVDVSQLLLSMKMIEEQVAGVTKLEKQPNWAAQLVARIDKLEKAFSASLPAAAVGQSPVPMTSAGGNAAAPNSMQTLIDDERVLTKMRKELESQIGSVKFTLEAKASGFDLEFERLHKLLEIRPTTSELQHVALAIRESERQMRDAVADVAVSTRALVQSTVTEQMDSLLSKLKANDELHEKSLGLVFMKIDHHANDIKDMKAGIGSFMAAMSGQLQESQEESNSILTKLDEYIASNDAEAAVAQQNMIDLRISLKSVEDSFQDFFNDINESQKSMESNVTAQDDKFGMLQLSIDTKLIESREAIEGCRADLEAFRAQCAKEYETTNHNFEKSFSEIGGLDERLTEAESFVEAIKNADMIGMVNRHQDELVRAATSFQEQIRINERVDAQFAENSVSTTRINDQIAALQTTTDDHGVNILSLSTDNIANKEELAVHQRDIRRLNEDLGKLYIVCEEINIQRDLQQGFEQRAKAQHGILQQLMESTDDHEQRIEQLVEIMDKSDESLQQKLEDMRGTMMDLLLQKQAEMDGALQNMRDNLDIMSQSGESGRGGGGNAGAVGVGFNKMKSAMGSSRMVSTADGGLAAISVSAAEQQALSLNHAQFVADLCINFEDISVRKTFVPEIPSAMCERMTATCQELAGFIASVTDGEMVQRVVGEVMAHETETIDGAISDLRQRKIQEFLGEVKAIVDANYPNPGLIRLDAREKFIKQLSKAIQIFISKHDQVLVVGNSRLGRIKIPTCIACDRPLAEKVRQDSIVRHEPHGESAFDESNSMMEGSLTDFSFHNTGKPLKNGKRVGNSGPIKLPRAIASSSSEKLLERPESQTAYVLRAGFKMPKLPNIESTNP